MSLVQSQQRRIAVLVSGHVHDIAVPHEDRLGDALLALGMLPERKQQLLDSQGQPVELNEPAGNFREGSLFFITGGSRTTHVHEGGALRAQRDPFLPWLILIFALSSVGFSLWLETRGIDAKTGVYASAFALCSLVTVWVWAARSGWGRYTWVPMLTFAMCISVLMWLLYPDDLMLALAAGAAAMATAGAVTRVVAQPRQAQVMGGALSTLFGIMAVGFLAASFGGWSLSQVVLLSGTTAVVGMRAVPSLLINVDDGSQIDFVRFMQMRWTVRGRVPKYQPNIDIDSVNTKVSTIETQLTTVLNVLSVLMAFGMWSATAALGAEAELVWIPALVALLLMPLGAVLTSRKMASPAFKTPIRAGAAIGLTGAFLIYGASVETAASNFLVALSVALLVAGLIGAVIGIGIGRGMRSIFWSRVGDIVEALSISFVVPAGLLALGIFDILGGVFSG